MSDNARERFRPYCTPEEFEKITELDTVTEMWERCLRDYACLTAIEFNGESHTYRELEEDAARFRAVLAESLKDGARVGIFIPNSYSFVRVYLAVVTLGMTAVVLPPHLSKEAVEGCCAGFGLDAVVFDPSLAEGVSSAKAAFAGKLFISADEGGEKSEKMKACHGKTPCVMMFTGGTTGKNKCALLSNTAVMQGTVNGCYGYSPVFNQRYLLVLPFSHVFGLIRNLMTVLYTGSTLYICKSNKEMFKDIAKFRPTVMVMVPALAEMALTLSKQFGRNMLGDDLKTIVCGAAAVAPYLIREYDKLGISLLQGYGLTESANLVSGNPESLKNPESIGLPYPNQEFKIVDGELWLKGKNMMDGYVGAQGEEPFTDGWFRTGDLVRIDDDGFMYITGRIKEIIVLPSGENISPAELETKFNALPFIQDSQVFEDENKRGKKILALEVVVRQTVLAAMKPENPVKFVTEELEKVNQSLPEFQRVTRITVRDTDFERTKSMKIVRYKK